MKLIVAVVPLVLSLAWTLPANAQHQVFKRGADLHESLQQDGVQSSNALNYIVGVVDAANGVRSRDGSCFDLGTEAVTGAQIVQVVRAFVLKNAAMKDQPGSAVVIAAMGEAWPCR